MASDGMEAIDLIIGPERPVDPAPQRGCLLAGCDCKDRRIVSRRRARFHAHLARARGETADRSIAPDTEWRLPEQENGDLTCAGPSSSSTAAG